MTLRLISRPRDFQHNEPNLQELTLAGDGEDRVVFVHHPLTLLYFHLPDAFLENQVPGFVLSHDSASFPISIKPNPREFSPV
jgi:hypothetical protein